MSASQEFLRSIDNHVHRVGLARLRHGFERCRQVDDPQASLNSVRTAIVMIMKIARASPNLPIYLHESLPQDLRLLSTVLRQIMDVLANHESTLPMVLR